MEKFRYCKLELFAPKEYLPQIEAALWAVDAGHIGAYDRCLSVSAVESTWRPLAGSDPFLGAEGELCRAEEMKVEVTCLAEKAAETVAAVKAAHPYEEPVINVLPLWMTSFD